MQIFASESRSIRNAVPFHSAVIEFLFTPERSESTLAEVIPCAREFADAPDQSCLNRFLSVTALYCTEHGGNAAQTRGGNRAQSAIRES